MFDTQYEVMIIMKNDTARVASQLVTFEFRHTKRSNTQFLCINMVIISPVLCSLSCP